MLALSKHAVLTLSAYQREASQRELTTTMTGALVVFLLRRGLAIDDLFRETRNKKGAGVLTTLLGATPDAKRVAGMHGLQPVVCAMRVDRSAAELQSAAARPATAANERAARSGRKVSQVLSRSLKVPWGLSLVLGLTLRAGPPHLLPAAWRTSPARQGV